ncbi:acyltransferase [Xanthomonas sp. LMG 8992]|uniref:acyltransferase n=1 Tax=Xanthomonas sp. LMG 8992 TaxID=1591157 RepID=UPI00136D9BBB|nr:acyltransferase [Xanthomonas sp. LMG 8992]MXV10833.1 acyltransferase [Xanthomonas sp. LMG 8992]
MTEDDYKVLLRKILKDPETEAFVKDIVLNKPLVFESSDGSNTLDIAASAVVNNATFNLSSGSIRIEDWAFFGHEVKLLTGSHDATRFDQERQTSIPQKGRDIVVKRGAWICTGAILVGPCIIGEHAVVAAGAVVTHDVPPFAVVGGAPAKLIKMLDGAVHEN